LSKVKGGGRVGRAMNSSSQMHMKLAHSWAIPSQNEHYYKTNITRGADRCRTFTCVENL